MRDYEYEVVFTNGTYPARTEFVTAGSFEHAIVLARAKRIKAGLDDTVASARQTKG